MKFERIVSLFIAALLLVSCSGDSKVDEFLDSYENAIVGFEKLAQSGSFTINTVTEMNQRNLELSTQANKLQTDVKWSGSQKERYKDLTTRYSQAMMALSQAPPSLR